jgi:hypothetical protein
LLSALYSESIFMKASYLSKPLTKFSYFGSILAKFAPSKALARISEISSGLIEGFPSLSRRISVRFCC